MPLEVIIVIISCRRPFLLNFFFPIGLEQVYQHRTNASALLKLGPQLLALTGVLVPHTARNARYCGSAEPPPPLHRQTAPSVRFLTESMPPLLPTWQWNTSFSYLVVVLLGLDDRVIAQRRTRVGEDA